MRSLLFVPGDSPRKLERALDSGADALIIDLEDSVAPPAKEVARNTTAEFLSRFDNPGGRPRIYVRVNALDTGLSDADLDSVLSAGPDGIMLPKTESGADVTLLDAKLTAGEAVAGLDDGRTKIIALTTETARSLFALGSLAGSSPRLDGVTWGAEDLSADIGAATSRDASGMLTDVYRLARALCLAAAASAETAAIDTVFTDFRDSDAFRRECEEAARDGFTGKMAIHPAQVPIINDVFTPSETAIAEAQAVIEAFGAAGADGVTSLEGRMLDRPHRRRAERILARAHSAGKALG